MIKKLLLVEDTIPIAELLKKELLSAGFTIEHTTLGNEAIAIHKKLQPDLVILDWMLPDIDGLEVLKTIRSSSNIPVIMLTAKSEEIDRILGLEIGADDYITKPFSVRELIARIHAIQRRIELVNSQLEADRNLEESPIKLDDLGLYPLTHQVKIGDEEIPLSRTEFDLLHLFMRNPNRVFSRPYLIEMIWKEHFIEGDRSVDNLVLRLRKKIKDYGERIETVWGVGYRFSWKK